jgi:transcriptional regulator with XRE-family HTH domain
MNTTKEKIPTPGVAQPIHDKTLANRLRLFREQYIDKSQTQAAKKLGIAQSTLSFMEICKLPIRYEFIVQLVKEFGLNQAWFDTGHGKPQSKEQPKGGLLTDLNELNLQLDIIQRALKKMELNNLYLLKIINNQNEKIQQQESRISALEKKLL